MIPNSSQRRKRSSLRRDESSSEDQNLSQNNDINNQMSSEVLTNSQSSGHFGVQKSTDLSQQISQSSVGSVDKWKGSQVINYKTFKKCSQNSSQNSIRTQEVIPLKKVQNDSYKQWLENESIEHKEEIGFENEKSNKRKMDSKEETKNETNIESNTPKKSRH